MLLIVVFSVVASLMLAFVSLYLYIKYQRKIREKQLLACGGIFMAEEAERSRISRDLHDEMGPVHSLVTF